MAMLLNRFTRTFYPFFRVVKFYTYLFLSFFYKKATHLAAVIQSELQTNVIEQRLTIETSKNDNYNDTYNYSARDESLDVFGKQ